MQSPNNIPECFGQQWSETDAECAGGYDPNYVGPNGGRIRPRCGVFDACRARTTMVKANEAYRKAQTLIAPQQLLRPTQQAPIQLTLPSIQSPTEQRPQPQPQQQQQQQPQQQPQMSLPQQPTQMILPFYQMPPIQYPPIVMPPIQVMPQNYQMPAYLSVPEHRQNGESFWQPLGREVLRGVGKALGHSLAHFFDVTTIKATKDD